MRHQTRKDENRSITKVGKVSKTDQSFKKATCINNMVAKFKKTGIAPIPSKQGIFADVSSIRTLPELFELSNVALDAFYSLPAGVRKLMNNDASKLEEFIANENNYNICVQHGLLLPKEVKKEYKGEAETKAKASTTTTEE